MADFARPSATLRKRKRKWRNAVRLRWHLELCERRRMFNGTYPIVRRGHTRANNETTCRYPGNVWEICKPREHAAGPRLLSAPKSARRRYDDPAATRFRRFRRPTSIGASNSHRVLPWRSAWRSECFELQLLSLSLCLCLRLSRGNPSIIGARVSFVAERRISATTTPSSSSIASECLDRSSFIKQR